MVGSLKDIWGRRNKITDLARWEADLARRETYLYQAIHNLGPAKPKASWKDALIVTTLAGILAGFVTGEARVDPETGRDMGQIFEKLTGLHNDFTEQAFDVLGLVSELMTLPGETAGVWLREHMDASSCHHGHEGSVPMIAPPHADPGISI